MKKSIPLKIENNEVLFADVLDSENVELILFCKNGSVFHYDCENPPKLISNKVTLNHQNLDFYSHENFICLVERYNTNGYVLSVSDSNYLKKLERGDYCVGACAFPIAFFSEGNQTFLIHATDWNRLDITNLESDELLTDRIIDDETEKNSFDYFHDSLLVSPNSKSFTSNGWHWHPYGQIYSFSIQKFLEHFEFSNNTVKFTDEYLNLEWNRPLCWINERVLGIGFNKKITFENGNDFSSEILFYDILKNKIIERIEFNGFSMDFDGEVSGKLYFQSKDSQFVSLNNQSGLLIADIHGNEISRDSNLTSHKYSSKHKFIYRMDYENQLMEITDLA